MKLSGLTTLIILLLSRVSATSFTVVGIAIIYLLEAIWKPKTPTKVCFFAWAVTKGKIPTEDMLTRRNFNGPNRCFMCLEVEETMDCFLIHYS